MGLPMDSILPPCDLPAVVMLRYMGDECAWSQNRSHQGQLHKQNYVSNSHGANMEPADNPRWGSVFQSIYVPKGLNIQILAGI